ncbi:MAG: polysaccharide deacetylase family protein [Treponemataceae bacterium]|nr:polysaccharide deacetylase family protein [Treponemataceae bacterium]
MKRRAPFFLYGAALLLCAARLSAGIQFEGGDINAKSEVLFTVLNDIPGTTPYRTLFLAPLAEASAGRPAILTCFPERMELLAGTSVLQIRNRYGAVWYNTASGSFSWKRTAAAVPDSSMRTAPAAVSPDGAWSCFIEKNGSVSGSLVIQDIANGRKKVLDPGALYSYEAVPVKWLDDSSVFIYEKAGNVYFCNPDAVFKGVEVSEEYRKIGAGSIRSADWAGGKYLVYIDGDMLYRINAKELYTLGLYSSIIGRGTAVGRLPFRFSASADSFYVKDDISELLLVKDGISFTHFKINGTGGDYLDAASSCLLSDKKLALLDAEVIWPDGSAPIIWLRGFPHGGSKLVSKVYRFDGRLTQILEVAGSEKPIASPDRKRCAFAAGSTLYVYDITTWKRSAELSGERIISAVWLDSGTLFVGGEKTIRRWSISGNTAAPVLLSAAQSAWWDAKSGAAVADIGNGALFTYDTAAHTWKDGGSVQKYSARTENGRYRIFLGETQNAGFDNALYARTLAGKPVTKAVLPESAVPSAPKKKVALLFDAYSNADGLPAILYELNRHNIPGTFFINGEFIRRYPNETRQIAASGNDCASLFFTPARLTSSEFVISDEFIRRGLARNEDEFFRTTGRELSLFWHAPHYDATERMVQAGQNAGYTYVDWQYDFSDSVTLEECAAGGAYYTAPQLIDMYMAAVAENGGGVIPITVGAARGSRESYVYNSLDLLISALLDSGCDIVPVRDLR